MTEFEIERYDEAPMKELKTGDFFYRVSPVNGIARKAIYLHEIQDYSKEFAFVYLDDGSIDVGYSDFKCYVQKENR